jgi:hypothetical protein
VLERINQGYKIIDSEAYRTDDTGREEQIVLGRMETRLGMMFVTWESIKHPYSVGNRRYDYFWGHYFDDEREAHADYHRRLLEKYE